MDYLNSLQWLQTVPSVAGLIILLLAFNKNFRIWISSLFVDSKRQQWREDISASFDKSHQEMLAIREKLDAHITDDTRQSKRNNLILIMGFAKNRRELIRKCYKDYVSIPQANGFVCDMYEELEDEWRTADAVKPKVKDKSKVKNEEV
jgi:hypothetical protein